MADKDKVLKGLECCINGRNSTPFCEKCPYADEQGTCAKLDELHAEARELLKDQEAVKPILVKLYPHDVYKCGNCGHCAVGTTVSKTYRPKYCPECGRKVKWDDK